MRSKSCGMKYGVTDEGSEFLKVPNASNVRSAVDQGQMKRSPSISTRVRHRSDGVWVQWCLPARDVVLLFWNQVAAESIYSDRARQ